MTKWQQLLKKLANNGDSEAASILWETREMSEPELARYVAGNDERIRGTLGLKYLAEIGADPEINQEYYSTLEKGQHAFEGDERKDVYGIDRLKTVDDFMKKFGVPTKEGGYTDQQRSMFTNPESPEYYRNLKNDTQLGEIASWLKYPDTRSMIDDIDRTASAYQRVNKVEGYDPNGNAEIADWLKSAVKGFVAPRIKEAELEGRPLTWADVSGDLVELGLNFVPGVGIYNKAGRLISKIPNRYAAWPLEKITQALDMSAVPLISQWYDKQNYTEGPRSEFDYGRLAAQTGMMGGGKYAGRKLARRGKREMSGITGESQAKSDFNEFRDFIGSIGEKTDDLLVARQNALNNRARKAAERKNVMVQGDPDIKKGNLSVDDVINAENSQILTDEARRIAASANERKLYNDLASDIGNRRKIAIENEKAAARSEIDALNADKANIENTAQERIRQLNEDSQKNFWSWMTDEEKEAYLKANNEPLKIAASEATIKDVPDLPEYRNNLEGMDKANARLANAENVKIPLSESEQKIVNDYAAANEKGAVDIVQLPDGRFVRRDNLDINGDYVVGGGPEKGGYVQPLGDERPGLATFKYATGLEPVRETRKAQFGNKEADRGHGIGADIDRNAAVKEAIKKSNDRLLGRVIDNKGDLGTEELRDAVASMIFTGAAHNDLVGQKLGHLDKKRADAYWNMQMRKLSKITDSSNDPADRKRNFNAVMDAMFYGLDNIPDDKFRKSPELFHRIAAELGYSDWLHPSELRAPDMPTESASRWVPGTSSSTSY